MLMVDDGKREAFPHNARDLWTTYGAPGKFQTWVLQLAESLSLEKDSDYVLKVVHKGEIGKPRREVFLSEAGIRKIQLGYGKTKHAIQSTVAQKTVLVDQILQNPRMLAKVFLEYADTRDKLNLLHQSDTLLTATEIAKDLGLESAIALNKALVEKGYLFRDRAGKHMPVAHKIPKECYDIKACGDADGKVFNYLKWTFQGKQWIAGILSPEIAVSQGVQ